MLYVADIYCGAGGLSEGFRRASLPELQHERFEVVYGVDRDPDAIATYRLNHFHSRPADELNVVSPCRSVVGLRGAEIITACGGHDIDVVIGGPNCQGVSSAGLRNSDDPRNEMFPEYLRLIAELRPAWFVMENVPGLVHSNNQTLLLGILRKFSAIPGYRVAADVLLAADYGVPQRRYRLFIIGTRTDSPIRFPYPTHEASPSRLYQDSRLTQVHSSVYDAIGDLEPYDPPIVANENGIVEPEGKQPVTNHVVFGILADNIARIKSIPPGCDWRSMPIGLLPERNFNTRACDQKGTYGRLSWQNPSYTITSEAGNVTAGRFTHPSRNRALSVREAARLQGFDDHYVFVGDTQSLYRQVGNAVPPPLAEAVAKAILRCHFFPHESDKWGKNGRITLEVLEDAVVRGKKLPVLTPRFADDEPNSPFAQRTKSKPTKRKTAPIVNVPTFQAEPGKRVPVEPYLIEALKQEAELPGNMRAGKRARTILGYFLGQSVDELLASAKVSEKSIRKWVDGFYREGIHGWRAYHTPLAALAGVDTELLSALEDSVQKVRQPEYKTDGKPAGAREGPVANRPHMNAYLRGLIETYKQQSVFDIIRLVEQKLGREVGTVYVDDLLAICHVLLSTSAAATGQESRCLLNVDELTPTVPSQV